MKLSESERELVVEYLPGPETPSVARRATQGLVSGDPLAGAHVETLMLLVSELVTNAVIHPDAPVASKVGLSIVISDELTRVVVSDGGTGFEWPAPSLPGGRPAGGFGLLLLDQTASRWGTLDAPNCFSVWFELDHEAVV
jgi:anti-sigma regulatory factor (Ser/Thr protein kinase)